MLTLLNIPFDNKFMYLGMILFSFVAVLVLLKVFKNKLPKDGGREFAFNGKLSEGKARGAGIVFTAVFVLAGLIFAPVTAEYIIYYVVVLASMLSGYLDDKSDKPWSEYKKGLIDLIICVGASVAFVYFNPDLARLDFFFFDFAVNKILFVCISTVFLWMMINATNCSDGIDGFCGTLSINSLIFIAIIGLAGSMEKEFSSLIIAMIFCIVPYLWYNAEPSTMMMGDAGSRAIGVFLGIALLETGNIILAIPLCILILLDGLLGIAKVSLKRFLKISIMKNIRTPLHDHFRKNKGWSNTQTIFRFQIVQTVISLSFLLLVK